MGNRVAIITGAGRGIGRAAATELAQMEYRLALVSRNSGELDETRKICGDEVEKFVCDVSDGAKVDDMVSAVLKRFGRVDALVHCAGLAMLRSIEQLTPQEWRALIDTNLSSVYYLCHRLWPTWRKLGGGVVVNVSSYAGRDPFPGLGAYGATKAGMNLFGMALAREGAEIGVRVHTVAPAATETAMLRASFSHEQIPKEKALSPMEVAKVIVQCVCGDLGCTSGEVIYVHKT
jgi:NAD(P)-dependent dehydrogenase (short-subunit alcohol dehydrogenase family)